MRFEDGIRFVLKKVIAGAGASAYCGSKAAVAMMTRCFAQDLLPFGINVNCVGPGATETALMISQVPHADAMKGLIGAIPMRRMATAEEVANTVAFYASPGAKYITGSFILQDGGLRDHTIDRNSELDHLERMQNELTGIELLEAIDKEEAHRITDLEADRKKWGVQ